MRLADRCQLPLPVALQLYSSFLGQSRARRTWGALRDLESSQWQSSAEVKERQMRALSEVLANAAAHVPYYRRLIAERGLGRGWFQAPEDLLRLPTLTRATLLANRFELVSEQGSAGRFVNFSSGSTGRRAEFVQDRAFIDFARALQFRGYGWCGDWQPGEAFALVWGSPVHKQFDDWKKRLSRGLINRRHLDCYRLGQDDLNQMLNRLVAFQPVLISGYTTALYLLGRLARRRGIEFTRLRAVQATAEPLDPGIRERMAADYGRPVFGKYGSRETNMVAHENPAGGGMLVQTENVFVEFLRPDDSPCAPGEHGEIVVTTLNNAAMPLIRYRTGDIAAPLAQQCRAGRGLPLMSEVVGRRHDVLATPDGGAIHPQLFSNIFMRAEEVDWFQVVQEAPDRLAVRVVAPDSWDGNSANRLADQIRAMTGQPFSIDFERLGEVPPSGTGKHPLCIRRCAAPSDWGVESAEVRHVG